jgi:hypothetical protein
MKSITIHRKILPAVAVLATLLALQWVWSPKPGGAVQRQTAEKINLAIRQAAHRLLLLEGDSASRIPPIR